MRRALSAIRAITALHSHHGGMGASLVDPGQRSQRARGLLHHWQWPRGVQHRHFRLTTRAGSSHHPLAFCAGCRPDGNDERTAPKLTCVSSITSMRFPQTPLGPRDVEPLDPPTSIRTVRSPSASVTRPHLLVYRYEMSGAGQHIAKSRWASAGSSSLYKPSR